MLSHFNDIYNNTIVDIFITLVFCNLNIYNMDTHVIETLLFKIPGAPFELVAFGAWLYILCSQCYLPCVDHIGRDRVLVSDTDCETRNRLILTYMYWFLSQPAELLIMYMSLISCFNNVLNDALFQYIYRFSVDYRSETLVVTL